MALNKAIFAAIIIILSVVAATAIYMQTKKPVKLNPAASPSATSPATGSPTETSTPTQKKMTSSPNPTEGVLPIPTTSSIQSPTPFVSPQTLLPSPLLTPNSSISSKTPTPQTATPNPSSPNSTPISVTPAPSILTPTPSGSLSPGTSTYLVLAWNDLGMHCYNPDFKDICVLPPYNNIVAQVLRKSGENARLVTSGITVSYFFPENTYSAGKTNFWTYANQTFNVALAENVGLTGKGLSGTMDQSGTYYEAKGIPLTEYTDQNPTVRQPFQQAIIVVTDSTTGKELCRTQIVAPVSTEMRCDTCHSDQGLATLKYPIITTNKTDTNILTLHDYLHPQSPALMESRPVLCGNCHSDNALGTTGKINVPSLSNAMHSNHNSPSIPITNDTNGCYNCHPGPTTQCLRDVMSQKQGFQCEDCHGGLAQVSTNPNPWLNEPRCDNPACHGSNATLGLAMNNPLYKSATGMGGIYCEGCHDSTHAIAPSRVSVDDIKFVALQGNPNELASCSVCHNGNPDDPFFHSSRRDDINVTLPYYSPYAITAAVLAALAVLPLLALRRKRRSSSHFSLSS